MIIWIPEIDTNSHLVSEMCTGNYVEPDPTKSGNGKQRPPAGTKCVGSCIKQSGRWGSSFCHTEADKSQWGAECVSCQGLQFEENLIFFIDHKF